MVDIKLDSHSPEQGKYKEIYTNSKYLVRQSPGPHQDFTRTSLQGEYKEIDTNGKYLVRHSITRTHYIEDIKKRIQTVDF